MAFLFVEDKIQLFNNLSNSKNIVFSAEKATVITRIVVSNRTNGEIRVNMEIKDPFATPLGEAMFHTSLRVKKNGSRDLTIAMPDPDDISNVAQPPTLRVPDGTNVIIYSDGATQRFDCTITYQELNESETMPGCS